MKKRKNTISASQLSLYASDPVKYCQAKGGAWNKEAAHKGHKAHNKTGADPLCLKVILILATAIVVWWFYV